MWFGPERSSSPAPTICHPQTYAQAESMMLLYARERQVVILTLCAYMCAYISWRILGFEARNNFSPALMLSLIVATYHTGISPAIVMHKTNCNHNCNPNITYTYITIHTHQSTPSSWPLSPSSPPISPTRTSLHSKRPSEPT